MDGDALGSSAALCAALRKLGKQSYILIEDEIAAFLQFLDNDYCTYDANVIAEPDICLCIDCGETGRDTYWCLKKETLLTFIQEEHP